jgi:hypothetical protein
MYRSDGHTETRCQYEVCTATRRANTSSVHFTTKLEKSVEFRINQAEGIGVLQRTSSFLG